MTKLEELKASVEEIKNEYLEQLEELKERIETLESEGEEETDNRWIPKIGEKYWWVDAYGDVCGDRWSNFDFEKDIFNHTDVFPTEEEAYLDKERKQIRRELMKYGKEFKTGEGNWSFRYTYVDNTLKTYYSSYIQFPFTIYFETEEIMRTAVEEVGEDRIKKYLFGVEE